MGAEDHFLGRRRRRRMAFRSASIEIEIGRGRRQRREGHWKKVSVICSRRALNC